MEHQQKRTRKKRSVIAKAGRVLVWISAIVLSLIVIALLLIQTTAVQNFARKKIVSYLEHKLKTPVEIGRLSIKFPVSISLADVLIRDRTKDTLLYGGELVVDISMLKLLKKDIDIEAISVDHIVAKIKRQSPDTSFNFQFIVDAFASGSSSDTATQGSLSTTMTLGKLSVSQSRILFQDTYGGSDIELSVGQLEMKISTFDPAHMIFDVPLVKLNGLHGHFFELQPLQPSSAKSAISPGSPSKNKLQFQNKEINLTDIDVAYRNDPSGILSSFKIGGLVLRPKKLDVAAGTYVFQKADITETAIAVTTGLSKATTSAADTGSSSSATDAFKIISETVTITNSSVKYDDNSSPHTISGLDYSHLYLSNLSLKAQHLSFTTDSISANIASASAKERSGFMVNRLTTDFDWNPSGVSLRNLDLETPGSSIKNTVALSYPSLEAVQKNPGALGLEIDLQQSKIAINDLQFFLPQLRSAGLSLPGAATLLSDARITGTVNNLRLEKLTIRGLTGTSLDVHGAISGLPNPQKTTADLSINYLRTNKTDILGLIPKGRIPAGITIPASLSVSGLVQGNAHTLRTNLALTSSMGSAVLAGTLAQLTDQKNAQYHLRLHTHQLALGTILQNSSLGIVDADATADGRGMKIGHAQLSVTASIRQITINHYDYSNISVNGQVNNNNFEVQAAVHDPNMETSLLATGTLSAGSRSLKVFATVDSIKTQPLHFTSEPIVAHCVIHADFSNIDPDHLLGSLSVLHTVVVKQGKRITLDSLLLNADTSTQGERSLVLHTDFLNASLTGRYQLTQLATIFQHLPDRYLAADSAQKVTAVAAYHFSVSATLTQNPELLALLPSLTELHPVMLSGTFINDTSWNVALHLPHIVYGANVINGLNITAGAKKNILAYNLSFDEIKNGPSFDMYSTALIGDLTKKTLTFSLNVKDEKSVDKYHLGGQLDNTANGTYHLRLNPENLQLNYEKWAIDPGNSLAYDKGHFSAQDFALRQGQQELSVNSSGDKQAVAVQVNFKDFKIATLTSIIQKDSLIVDGLLNGHAVVSGNTAAPTVTADLLINDLSVYKDTIGNLTAKLGNQAAGGYYGNINLQGKGNEVTINGTYLTGTSTGTANVVINIVSLQMKAVEGFSKGAIKNARGSLSGKISLNGTLNKPSIDGSLAFNDADFNLAQLNNVFKIDKGAGVILNNQGIAFSNFTVRDTANNALTIAGNVNTTDFYHYDFDLSIKAKNFQATNSTAHDNKLFYGKMVFSTNLLVKGSSVHPVVTGTLSIDDKTDFTVVMPQEDPGVASREGIVRFVNYYSPAVDSTLMIPYDSLNLSSLVGYDISVNISINQAASFNLILDQANGDFLKLKGSGQLTAGIDASGKVTLVGTYEINEGAYNLAFNFLKRQFLIQKGSRIVWTGEPTTAQIDVTAIYIANSAPVDLVQAQITSDPTPYKQKLPFEVHLHMAGELLKPTITFDILLPTEKNYNVSVDLVNTVQNILAQLRQDPGEMNKQVFALLLLNRFVGQNPFQSNSGSTNAGTIAMQSASRLLGEQLNNLTKNLIAGVDINFDLATTQDYTTGSQQNRTDLNVGVSKRLLNDRLTVTVGNDFQLTGPQPAGNQQENLASDVSVTYKLSKDGKYMLRAYRKNDYTDIIEGYVIETGVGFIVSVDYNKFKEIFTTKQQRSKKKSIRKSNSTPNQGGQQDNQPAKNETSFPNESVSDEKSN